MNLQLLGWSEYWDKLIQPEESPARVSAVHRGVYKALYAEGEINCYTPGKLQHCEEGERPAVGDWVVMGAQFIDEQNSPAAMIDRVLRRQSKLSRVRAGSSSGEQVFAANVKYAFIVTSANMDLNLRRLQRYLLLAEAGGVEPVIVLSKVDLFADWQQLMQQLCQAFPTVKVLATSVVEKMGIDSIRDFLQTGTTSVFVGSSGVGKSTLVNEILGGQIQLTQDIREGDSKGRHTTTSKQLFILPDAGMVIDTPGVRELQVFGDEESLRDVFSHIEEIMQSCKFSDCSHTAEPGCAVNEAIESEQLSLSEWQDYQKLLNELRHSNRKKDKRESLNLKKKSKNLSKHIRQHKKNR